VTALRPNRPDDGQAATPGDAAASGLPDSARGDSERIVISARYADFLPEAQSIAAREHSPYARWLIVVVALLVVVLLGWAAIAEVDKIAVAQGHVRPDGRVKVINHPDGGRIRTVFVDEGERVIAGQPLVEFDAELIDEEIASLTNDWRNALAQAARLEAEAADRAAPDFPSDLRRDATAIVANQLRLFETRRSALTSRRAAADEAIERLDHEANALAREVATLEASAAYRRQQESTVRELVDKGYYSNLRFLTLQRELSETQGDLAEAQDRLLAKFAELEAAREERLQVDEDYRAEVLTTLAEARLSLEQTTRALSKLQAGKRNLVVKAPVDGIIQDVAVNSTGQSVSQNEALMRLVPTGDKLVIEARVPNQEIGFVEAGQQVEVRVETYDFVTFGTLPGIVEQIAADATEDADSPTRAFNYVVLIRTERNHLGPAAGNQPVVPGMRVTADIKIGSRTVLSFLTDRVVATTRTAFRER
jgi:HlyD family type I secretion membrane fusion protein